MKKGYLILSNGRVFEGTRIGFDGDTRGEAVFTTGVCGYTETLTDPSYFGQIVVQTFPLIGNYGVCSADFEGVPALSGYVVRSLCDAPSNFRSEETLDSFLKANKIVGLCGVDTREITRLLREQGVMNAVICSSVPDSLDSLFDFSVTCAVENVSAKAQRVFLPDQPERFRVTLLDYGAKMNIIRSLCGRGCRVTLVPHDTAAEVILADHPDGVMLSNGPGDPAENVFEIEQIKKLIGLVPLFGICLGHQLTALAMGAKTEKLKFGHRGANQPVKEINGSRTYITSQNHGYAVVNDSVPACARLRYVNANDGSCEGIDYPSQRAFTVQFHPEACGGPHDTSFLFDRFIALMGGESDA